MKTFIKAHKFGISLLFALVIGAMLIHFSGGCPIYRIFHKNCLSCGMLSACLAALRLDFREAFCFHPMFWSVPILALYVIFEGKLFKKKYVNILVITLIAIGFAVQYVLKLNGVI